MRPQYFLTVAISFLSGVSFGSAVPAHDLQLDLVPIEARDERGNHLEKRAAGKIVYDNEGRIKVISSIVLSTRVGEVFYDSGFNMAKAFANGARHWALNSGNANYAALAIRAAWSAQFEWYARYLDEARNKKLQTVTVAILLETSGNIAATAQMLSTWISRGPTGATIENLGSGDAWAYGNAADAPYPDPLRKRALGGEGVFDEIERRDGTADGNSTVSLERRGYTKAEYCAGSIGGMQYMLKQGTWRGLHYYTSC